VATLDVGISSVGISQFLTGKTAKFIAFIPIALSAIYLLFYYRDGGNMHDAGVYIDSGFAVFKGENPYECCSRWGSFGPVPFSALMSLVPFAIRATTVRILSLIGIYLFLRTIFPSKRTFEPYFMFLIILWSSPVRELLVTNQMTGIAIGLLALGVKLNEGIGGAKPAITSRFFSAIFFVMALDMKPHISLVFFLSWIIYKREIKSFIWTIVTLVTTHIIIDLSQFRILELDWLSNLRGVNASASQNTLGDSLAFWPILNNYFAAGKFFYYFSFLLTICLTILCFNLAKNRKWEVVVVLSFFIPATSIYFHFYDVVPLSVVLGILVVRIKNLFPTTFCVSMFLIPIEYRSAKNIILVLVIALGLFAVRSFRTDLKQTIGNLFLLMAGLFGSLGLHLFNSSLHLSDHLLQSLIVTECLILVMSLYAYSKKKSVFLIEA